MADYPIVAEQLRGNVRFYAALPRPSGGDDYLHNYMHAGPSITNAAVDTAAAIVADYVMLANGCECTFVRVWKIFEDWSSFDGDINLSLTVGNATRALSLKVLVSVTSDIWTLTLYDWSSSAGPFQWSGPVDREQGRIVFRPPRRATPTPPPPVYPDYDDDDTVPT